MYKLTDVLLEYIKTWVLYLGGIFITLLIIRKLFNLIDLMKNKKQNIKNDK